MHKLATSFVLGYHGCSSAVAEKVLSGENFKPSKNDFDWLGEGAYFWEANPRRGLHYYREYCARNNIDANDATVVGAVIDLANCLDLTTSSSVEIVKESYELTAAVFKQAGQPIPTNGRLPDLLTRRLDCAVINMLFTSRKKSSLPLFDTVRGIFIEGEPIYPGAGIREKTHIQIAVRNPDCIKGVFKVKKSDIGE